jgi:flavin-dependent dehydrogenase
LVAFSLSFADRERDGTTLVEAVPEGWWYTARLPGGRRIAVFLTDRDLPAAREARTRAGFAALLERTQEVHRRLQGYREDGGAPRAHAAATRILAPVAGPGWIAVGDAALTTDPLAAQGVLTALYSGLLAGRALAAGGGQEELLAAYPTALQSVFDAHRRHRALYYQQEKRFAGEPFWQRRQIQIE